MNNEFSTKISYEKLRQIIFNYFKEVDNIELGSVSIDYLREKLTGKENVPPFFIMKNELGESRFDIPKEDIEKILAWYLKKSNYEFTGVKYDYNIIISYKMSLSLGDDNKNEKIENKESEKNEKLKSSSFMHM